MVAEPRPLLLVGAGGFGRETAEAIRALNAVRPTWHVLGFLDDDPALHGKWVQGLEVVGPLSLAQEMEGAFLVVCTGRPDNYFSRKRIVHQLGLADDRYATIIHPAATLADSTMVGVGSVILAGVVSTASVVVGRHVAVMPGAVFTHDDQVADYCTVASGVRLGGTVRLEEGAYVGAGAVVREGRNVGAWSLVGMGAVVTRDVPAAELWAGVPAKARSVIDVPADLLEG